MEGRPNLSRLASRGTSEDARHSILVIPKPNAAEESTSPRNFVAPALSTAREWNSQSQSSGLHEERARTRPPLHSCHSEAERGGGIYLSPELRCPRALNSARMEFPISVVRLHEERARTRPPLHSCHSDAERGGGIYLSPELRCPFALSKAREWNSIVSARCDRK